MQRIKVAQNAIVVLAGVLFISGAFSGLVAGKNSAISNVVLQNSRQLASGLEYFKADQDRYPSEFEYANQDLMGSYFNVFPPAELAPKACPENFVYQSPDQKTYMINFCLPKGVQGYHQGWNQIPSFVSPE